MFQLVKKLFATMMIALCVLAAFSCSVSDNNGITLSEEGDNSTTISDGGAYEPAADGDVAPCTIGSDGNCEETTDNTESVSITTKEIDFGLSEVGAVECSTITIPGGLSYAAEIDDVNDHGEFGFMTSSGSTTQERVEGTGSVSVCYLRTATGSHKGQFKLVINSDSSSSAYAYIIVLTGETSEPFFTITSPTDGQIVYDADGFNEGRDDDEGDWYLTGAGTVNTALLTTLASGAETPVIIESAGVKYRADIGSEGNFSTQIGVPQTAGIYSVTFSVETADGTTLSKSLSVVVADKPSLKITVKDSSGNDVSAGIPSDVQNLIVGFQIDNLDVAGSSQTAMPVALSELAFNGVELSSGIDMWYDASQSWCPQSGTVPATAGDDYTGFTSATTYCVPLAQISEVQSGENKISATATNDLGESTAEFILILDYNKPVITITSPHENELLEYGTKTLTISGSVANYAPVTLTDGQTIPETKSADVGSYCRVADGEDEDSACPSSSVELWINTNPDTHPIYVYPELDSRFDGLSDDDINKTIILESPERCRDFSRSDSNADGVYTVDEITVSSATQCNRPLGTFSLSITLPDEALAGQINTYGNIIEMRAESLADLGSHRTIAIRTFHTGTTNAHSFDFQGGAKAMLLARTGDLTTGSLGQINDSTGLIKRSPVMFNISEGTLDSTELRYVLQHFLNENFPFMNLANGWDSWPKDDDGNVDIEADFQRQYKAKYGENYDDFVTDVPFEDQKTYIHQALHSSVMAMKHWSIMRYQQVLAYRNEIPDDTAYLYFFNRYGDPQTEYNVARDSCDQAITTAFTPVGDLQKVVEHMGIDPRMAPEWPDIAGYSDESLEFNDFVSGRWIIQSVEFKEGTGNTGLLNFDACVVPSNADVDSCDDEIPFKDDLLPAMWGHFVSYNIVEGGLMGNENALSIDDPTIPLIWSVGKIRVKFEDVVRLEKIQLDDGTWTNKIQIDEDFINDDNRKTDSKIVFVTNPNDANSMYDVMAGNSVQIWPYSRCEDYYNELLDNGTYDSSGGTELPFGCDQENTDWNKPFLLELNTTKSAGVYNSFMATGDAYYVANVIWEGVMETFGKLLRCTDTEVINPSLNSDAFPYPSWVQEDEQTETNFVLDNDDGDLNVVSASEAENPLFEIGLDTTIADLNINHALDASSASGLTVRLPFTLTVNDVANSLNLGVLPGLFTGERYETANTGGHLVRTLEEGDLEDYPLHADSPEEDVFLGASLNIEEIFNAGSYLIYKKGPFSLLELLDMDGLTPTDDYTIGVDKVVLAEMGICDNIGGVLNTDLPPGILFSNVQSIFDSSALHLDVILDKNSPPTLSLNPIAGLEDSANASEIKITVTNVQLSVKELQNADVENYYTIGDEEILRVRLDGVLSLKAVYQPELMQFNLYVLPYDEQNLHLSVVPGHGGALYDDVNVITNLASDVLSVVVGKLSKTFPTGLTEDDLTASEDLVSADNPPSISIKLKSAGDGKISLTDDDLVEVTFNIEEAANGECVEGSTLPQYASEKVSNGKFDPSSLQTKGILSGVPGINLDIGKKSDSNETETISQNGGTFSGLGSGATLTLPDSLKIDQVVLLSSVCTENGLSTIVTDTLEDALCDFGIESLEIKPALRIDNDNGYLHLSSELFIEIYDWLVEENI